MSYDFELKFDPDLKADLIESIHQAEPEYTMFQATSHVEFTLALAPIQICVFSETAGMALSHISDPSSAKTCFERAWRSLVSMQDATDGTIFDPQVGRKISLSTDFELCRKCYLESTKIISESFSRLKRKQSPTLTNFWSFQTCSLVTSF